jgi:hypothetical protein
MDISNIASLATTMASTATQEAIGMAVQRKAMDIQANSAAALLAALPSIAPTAPTSGPNLPAHLGQNVNTTA